MLYEDPIEIIEALGLNPVFGRREWFDGMHVGDLRALVDALYLAQSRRVRWDRNKIHGDPFNVDFQRSARELMIDVSSSGPYVEVAPSFYTYRARTDYLVELLVRFYTDELPPDARPKNVSVERADRVSVIVSHDSVSRCVLNEIPEWYEYKSAQHLKGELLRFLFEASELVFSRSTNRYKVKPRDYAFRAVCFADELWGASVRA